ncbi:MAG: hypothetical protein LH479_11025, partial [Polaromonas sp.]|nr:hypothetical protein [Polaromonas sp.]
LDQPLRSRTHLASVEPLCSSRSLWRFALPIFAMAYALPESAAAIISQVYGGIRLNGKAGHPGPTVNGPLSCPAALTGSIRELP